jgi:hypothetical protein
VDAFQEMVGTGGIKTCGEKELATEAEVVYEDDD